MLPSNASAVLAVPVRPAAEPSEPKDPDPSGLPFAGMVPKKAAKLMDQLAPLDAKLAGRLSERVGLSNPKEPSA